MPITEPKAKTLKILSGYNIFSADVKHWKYVSIKQH